MKGTGEYSQDWNEVAREVKEAAGWKCVRCGHPHEPATGYCLTVHHLDGDKSNNAWWNTPALCQRCHLQIQAKVKMQQIYLFPHSDWFKPYVAGYYAHLVGASEERDSVMENLDNLIGLFIPQE